MSFTFGSPFLLPGLLLLAAPLIVHLLAKARPRPYKFSSLELIRRVQRRSARVRKPRDWLLLLLRTLLVAALLGLFLRPTLYLAGAPGDAPRTVVLLVDASASMQASEGGRSRFAAAVAEASQVLDGLRNRDRANLIFLGRPARAVFNEPGINHGFLRDELRQAQAGYGLGAPAAGIRQALAQFAEAPGPREIVWISDFQSSTIPAALPDLPPDVQLVRIPVGGSDLPNQAVLELSLDPPRPLAGEEAVALVEIARFAEGPGRAELRLSLGPKVHQRSLSLEGNGRQTVAIPIRMPEEGPVTVEAQIQSDAFPADDHRRLVAPLTDGLGVALLGGTEPQRNRLAAALRVFPWTASDAAPADADAILVLDDADDTMATTRQAQAAGSLVILAAEGSDHPGPTALVDATSSQSAAWKEDGKPVALELRQPNHPLFRVFREGQFGDPTAAEIRARLHPSAAITDTMAGAEILLGYADDVPALTWLGPDGERRGTLVWWNLPLDPAVSDLAGRPEFLPLLGETLLRGRPLRLEPGQLPATPGDPLHPPTSQEGEWAWRSSADEVDAVFAPLQTGEHHVGEPAWIEWTRNGNPAGRSAVNLATAESDLRLRPDDEVDAGRAAADAGSWQATRSGIALWPWFLAAAALLVLFELFASYWAAAAPRRATEEATA